MGFMEIDTKDETSQEAVHELLIQRDIYPPLAYRIVQTETLCFVRNFILLLEADLKKAKNPAAYLGGCLKNFRAVWNSRTYRAAQKSTEKEAERFECFNELEQNMSPNLKKDRRI